MQIVSVSPFSTQLREIGSAYPEFMIIVMIGLWKPMLNQNQAQILYCSMMFIVLQVDDGYFLTGSKDLEYIFSIKIMHNDMYNWQ